MGASQSKDIIESEEVKTLRLIAENKGPAAVQQFIKANVNKWKDEQVKFAVTGQTATGKSTFINVMRDVRLGDPTYAKSGTGSTTKKPKAYEHPKNRKLIYYDLPGFATLHCPKEKYIKEMKLNDYDYFLIFFDKVINEDDSWLVKMLTDLNKPFCLVRSKLDIDINSAKHDGEKKGEVIPAIKTKIERDIERHNYMHPDNIIDWNNVFFISSRDPSLGDMERLLDHIQKKLSVIKFEVMMYSLRSLSKKVIEKKYEVLKKRSIMVTAAAAAVSALPIKKLPGFNVNMAFLNHEIAHYVKVFGLTHEDMKTIPGLNQDQLKCRNVLIPGVDTSNLIIGHIEDILKFIDVTNVARHLAPYIGTILSASTTTIVVYLFFSRFLDDIRADAEFVFEFICSQISAKL